MVVMEYKNRGHINRAQFEKGLIRDSSYSNRREIMDKINVAKGTANKSLMDHNAVVLTKQGAAYATKWRTRFVCLFDWDNFFLWHFAGCDFRTGASNSSNGLGLDGHARWAWWTHVEKRQDYRKALLGFILEAYKDRNNARFEHPKQPPFEMTRAQNDKARAGAAARLQQQLTPQQVANANVYGRRG